MRRTYGKTQTNPVSRFLGEIPSRFVNVLTPPGGESPFIDGSETVAKGPNKKGSQHYDNADKTSDNSDLSEGPIVAGTPVTHPTYGIGNVEEIETNFGRPKVLVRFRDIGLRRVEAHHLSRGHDYF